MRVFVLPERTHTLACQECLISGVVVLRGTRQHCPVINISSEGADLQPQPTCSRHATNLPLQLRIPLGNFRRLHHNVTPKRYTCRRKLSNISNLVQLVCLPRLTIIILAGYRQCWLRRVAGTPKVKL